MKTRILSGLLMAPLLILVYLGGWFIWAAALLVAIIGCKEFYKGFEASGAKPCYALGYTAIVALFVTAFAKITVVTSVLIPLWIFLVVVC